MNLKVKMRANYKDSLSPLKATADIVIDDCFVVHNIKIIDHNYGRGPYVKMPDYRRRDGKWIEIAHPLTPNCRAEIQAAVLEAYLAD